MEGVSYGTVTLYSFQRKSGSDVTLLHLWHFFSPAGSAVRNEKWEQNKDRHHTEVLPSSTKITEADQISCIILLILMFSQEGFQFLMNRYHRKHSKVYQKLQPLHKRVGILNKKLSSSPSFLLRSLERANYHSKYRLTFVSDITY